MLQYKLWLCQGIPGNIRNVTRASKRTKTMTENESSKKQDMLKSGFCKTLTILFRCQIWSKNVAPSSDGHHIYKSCDQRTSKHPSPCPNMIIFGNNSGQLTMLPFPKLPLLLKSLKGVVDTLQLLTISWL